MKGNSFQEDWIFGEVDKKKRKICLPHDAMLGQGRSPNSESGSGCASFRGGIYEYEKTFSAPAVDVNKLW